MSKGPIPASTDSGQPLVSVGIPTFNRPEGMLRTLNQILGQTHRNLEVIVSDNASTDPEVEWVGRDIAARDGRVRYIRQPTNLGAMANFKEVLKQATGEYFMWAADDDEWDPLFVESCLRASVKGESVGCKFDTLFRYTGQRESNPMPSLAPEQGALANIEKFFECMQPSLIYGLHRRAALDYFDRLPTFDFVDCYFVIHQILEPGMRTIPDVLFTAGVDAATYQIKYTDAQAKKVDYAPFYVRTAWLLLRSRNLTIGQKRDALKLLKQTTCGLIKHHEKCEDPRTVLATQLRRLGMRSLSQRRIA